MAATTDRTVVTERGQTSIPAHLRQALALRKGQQLVWRRVSERELRVVVLDAAAPVGAMAMRGFARRFRPARRSTADWMRELREGER